MLTKRRIGIKMVIIQIKLSMLDIKSYTIKIIEKVKIKLKMWYYRQAG